MNDLYFRILVPLVLRLGLLAVTLVAASAAAACGGAHVELTKESSRERAGLVAIEAGSARSDMIGK